MAHTDPSSPFSNSGLTTNDSEPECLNMITKGHIHTASPSLASVNTGEVREIGLVSATDSGVIINPAVPLKLPEIGDPVAVTGDGHGERPVLSELPYSLRTRKLKIAIIALIVSLDGFIMPTCIFYILKNTAHLSDTRNVAITTAAFGIVSFLQYVIRMWRLLKPNSPYLPIDSPHRWYLDFYQIQFTIGFILISLVFTFACMNTSGQMLVRITSIAPCILLLQCGPQFLLSCIAYKRKWVNPFRISSSLEGEQAVPALFTIVEDVIAVDGRGGGKGGFRESWKRRYTQSHRFREILYTQTIFWGLGSTMGGAITLVVVLAPTVNVYVAYGLGWCLPFLWSGLMAVITTIWVQKGLAFEREEWDSIDLEIIRGYQLHPRA